MKKILILSGLLILITNMTIAQNLTTASNPKNKVAILPMIYIGDGSDEDRSEEMRYRLQQFAVDLLSRSAFELKFQDPATINALLLRKGINENTIREYTPAELADILHVEYIIMGTVLQDMGPQVTVSRTNNVRKQYDNRGRDYDDYRHDRNHGHNNNHDVIRRETHTRSTVINQHYRTEVSISIYNGEGEKIYSKSRESILSDADAYKAALQFLLKRQPLYNR
jgi:hypothetical protein